MKRHNRKKQNSNKLFEKAFLIIFMIIWIIYIPKGIRMNCSHYSIIDWVIVICLFSFPFIILIYFIKNIKTDILKIPKFFVACRTANRACVYCLVYMPAAIYKSAGYDLSVGFFSESFDQVGYYARQNFHRVGFVLYGVG